MSRSATRERYNDHVRLELVEDDIDDLEVGVAAVTKTLSKILWTLVGLLITITTSSIFLALNLVVN